MVAGLARRFGDLDVAEEAAAEAFVAAAERWPRDGIPPNPGGWLTTTATRKAIDRLRRESQRDAKHQAARMLHDDTPPSRPARSRTTGSGWSSPAATPRSRWRPGGADPAPARRSHRRRDRPRLPGAGDHDGARITRAKAKIKAAHIPYRVPSADDLRERLAGVLAVVYLVFNEGYLAGDGDDPVRVDLTDEAIRLGRLLGPPAGRRRGGRPAGPDAPRPTPGGPRGCPAPGSW